jgi:iron complex transport system substrate-binding protein
MPSLWTHHAPRTPRRTGTRRTIRTGALVTAVAILAVGCGGSSSTGATASTAPSPSPTGPSRIVSLSATATEMLFAIDAGSQVVAVDDQSNFPATAPKTKLSAYEPNAEAIAGYHPDLVVISDDTKNLKAQLAKLSIPVLVSPAAKVLDDSYREITELGATTGHVSEAEALVNRMKSEIADATKTLTPRAKPLTYYHELDSTLFSATSKTFIGQLYTMAGLRNIADPADKQSGGYPQLSAEYLVKADPDLIFLGDTKCCKQTAATFAKRPGFAKLKAVRDGHVVLLDDDIASRWGPRVVDFLKQIIQVISGIPAS